MLKALRRRLTFANVVAVMALFVALSGTVYAAGKISGTQIKKSSEPGNRIKKQTITGTQVKLSGPREGSQRQFGGFGRCRP